jgi:hypothetical protein
MQKQKDLSVILDSVRAAISPLPPPALGAAPATPTPAPAQRLATPTPTQPPVMPSTPLSAQQPQLSAQALHAAQAASRQETQARQIASLLREQQTLRRLLAERDRRDRSRSRERPTRDRDYRDDRDRRGDYRRDSDRGDGDRRDGNRRDDDSRNAANRGDARRESQRRDRDRHEGSDRANRGRSPSATSTGSTPSGGQRLLRTRSRSPPGMETPMLFHLGGQRFDERMSAITGLPPAAAPASGATTWGQGLNATSRSSPFSFSFGTPAASSSSDAPAAGTPAARTAAAPAAAGATTFDLTAATPEVESMMTVIQSQCKLANSDAISETKVKNFARAS